MEAKKKGHSIYAFNRNFDHFHDLYLSVNNKDTKVIEIKLKRPMSMQNLTSFAKFLANCKEVDKQFVIEKKEGKDLFQSFIQPWTSENDNQEYDEWMCKATRISYIVFV